MYAWKYLFQSCKVNVLRSDPLWLVTINDNIQNTNFLRYFDFCLPFIFTTTYSTNITYITYTNNTSYNTNVN